MGSEWIYKYGNDTITVVNDMETKLLVNGVVRDSVKGIHLKADMSCVLDSGETVRACLRGTVEVECILSINDVIQKPVDRKSVV